MFNIRDQKCERERIRSTCTELMMLVKRMGLDKQIILDFLG
jgi:hypothetical protein